jgi:hypothetical protein
MAYPVLLAANDSLEGHDLLQQHSGEILIFILATLVLGTLLVLVPQLLRARHQALEMQHTEHMRALEEGKDLPCIDVRSVAAGQTTVIVPSVVVISAGTVTCFLTAYRTENLFGVVLAVWSVAGVVSLAAITGGVALMGRLAQLQSGRPEEEDDEVPSNPLQAP